MTTVSEPIVTSSPIATPSWMRTCARMSQDRPRIAPSIRQLRPVGRHVLQHLRLEHVDAGVDRVREDLAPGRLLEEALDPSLVVGDDDAELERVLNRLEPDRHCRAALLVKLDQLGQVDVAER